MNDDRPVVPAAPDRPGRGDVAPLRRVQGGAAAPRGRAPLRAGKAAVGEAGRPDDVGRGPKAGSTKTGGTAPRIVGKNRSGYWEIGWSERCANGGWRTARVST